MASQSFHPMADAAEGLRFYRDYVADAPDGLEAYAYVIRVPPIPAVPDEYPGQTDLDFGVTYAGNESTGDKVLRPLRTCGAPILDGVRPQLYMALQQTFDDGVPKGPPVIFKGTRSPCAPRAGRGSHVGVHLGVLRQADAGEWRGLRHGLLYGARDAV